MHRVSLFALALTAFSAVQAQQVGTLTAETHPSLSVQTCTKSGGCTTLSRSVVLDSNWRWTHTTSGSTNCYDANAWITSYCPDPKTCAQNCAIEGADYSGTYGVTTSGNALNMRFVTKHAYGTNVGARVYLLENTSKYQMLKLLNKEFTFDVDTSNLDCGLNGALYLSEMDSDGGMAKYSTNKAGAKYGTGYCDAQCPHDIKWINGEANVQDWNGTGASTGNGRYGTCCHEMDIWEANKVSNAYTPHPCDTVGPVRCEGTQCGDADSGDRYNGLCDKDGCDINPFRLNNKDFYGVGKSGVDTSKPFTVVTQFITSDGTDNGDLVEIRRLYVQNGKVINTPKANYPEISQYDSITDQYCVDSKALFDNENHFKTLGGLKAHGEALRRGMVLVMSVWADDYVRMLWLDAPFPTDADPTIPGVARGECSIDSGDSAQIQRDAPNSSVKYSNIKWGEIGSTFSGAVTTTTTARTTTTTTTRTSTTTARTSTTTPITTTTTTSRPPVSTTCAGAQTVTVTAPGSVTTINNTVYVTVNGNQPTTTTTRTTTTTTRTSTQGNQPGASLYGQCGGQGWTGPTTCSQGTCRVSNQYYSQCLP